MGFFRRRKAAASRKPSQSTTNGATTEPNKADTQQQQEQERGGRQRRRRRQRDRLPPTETRFINPVLTLVPFLLLYLAWTSYSLSKTPEWRARVWGALERELGWTGGTTTNAGATAATIPGDNGDGGDDSFGAWIPPEEYLPVTDDVNVDNPAPPSRIRHRIPCGLMIRNDNDDDDDRAENVLPLSTLAIAEGGGGSSGGKEETPAPPVDPAVARSTLHARALDRYPELGGLTVLEASTPPHGRFIPRGAFRLRMGSVESTIEDSPPLWIVEHDNDDDTGSDGGETIDLVLGGDFWDDHRASFGTDEIDLVREARSGSSTTTNNNKDSAGSRITVPYIVPRSRPSFGTDL